MMRIQPLLLKLGAISAAAALLLSAPAAGAAPAETAWMPGALSRARLVAAGGMEAGNPVYRLAVEIALTGDAHTYWRMPGDAGVPPTISFEGSENLKSADLAFPVPQRMDEAGLQIFGYKEGVLLPLTVTPQDPAKPVRLAFAFSYAACEKICIPADARGSLDLQPRAKPTAHAQRIVAATAAIPRRTRNGDAARLELSPQAGEKPTWSVKVSSPAGPWRDLFAEAPDGWYFETRRSADGFEMVAIDKPKDADYPVPVRLTIAGEPTSLDVDVEVPRP